MNENNKIKFGWLAFIFIVVHFGLIIISAFPDGYLPQKTKTLANHYVLPVFEQQWAMFAPCPYYSYEINAKYRFDDIETNEWIRPAQNAIDWHSVLRMSHHGEIGLVESNVMYWVNLDLKKLNIDHSGEMSDTESVEFMKTPSWNLLARYVYGASYSCYDKYPNSALVKVIIKDVRDGTEQVLLMPELKWNL